MSIFTKEESDEQLAAQQRGRVSLSGNTWLTLEQLWVEPVAGPPGGETEVWEELKRSAPPPPPPLQEGLHSDREAWLMCAARPSWMVDPRQAGIGQETREGGHLAPLQPIEPVPDRQSDCNMTNVTGAAKIGRGRTGQGAEGWLRLILHELTLTPSSTALITMVTLDKDSSVSWTTSCSITRSVQRIS